MAGDFAGKVALVTGGAYGIGRAAGLKFALRGARVVVADVDVRRGDETVRQIEAAGGEAIFVKTDVSKEADVSALVEKTVATYGSLDYAFNNAGIHKVFVSTIDFLEADWNEMIDINLKSVWLCMKHEIPGCSSRGKGPSSIRLRRPVWSQPRATRLTRRASTGSWGSRNRPPSNSQGRAYGLTASAPVLRGPGCTKAWSRLHLRSWSRCTRRCPWAA